MMNSNLKEPVMIDQNILIFNINRCYISDSTFDRMIPPIFRCHYQAETREGTIKLIRKWDKTVKVLPSSDRLLFSMEVLTVIENVVFNFLMRRQDGSQMNFLLQMGV